ARAIFNVRTRSVVESPVVESPRVAQVAGMFTLPPTSVSRVEWDVHLPLEEKPWHVGLIVGPSGCGKSTIARNLWPEALARSSGLSWPADASVLDGFPPIEDLETRDLHALLCSVGFSSPPEWMRPFRVLSTGQQFRAT